MYKIIENYLPENDFDTIMNYINYPSLNWFFCPKANKNSKENDFQLMHNMIDVGKECFKFTDYDYDIVRKIVSPFNGKNKKYEICRLRMNMFLKTVDYQNELGYHIDLEGPYNSDFITMLIYLEDSNGYTQFKDTKEKIESKRNRALIFNSSIEHQTITQTDIPIRRNININFKEIQ